MVIIHKEKLKSNFDGTIIDIETIGEFSNEYNDSRKYKQILPVIFGFIDRNGLSIYCAKNEGSLDKLKNEIPPLLDNLERPFYAFNCHFEMGVFFHSLNKKVLFERELNERKYERKSSAVSKLNIPQYDDPFNDRGVLCKEAWLQGQIDNAIAHNRSCLLKERDILLKRGFREPDKLIFIND